MPILIMFRSLTYAQRASYMLARGGIGADVIKAPQETTDRGCTYCIRIAEGKLYRALDILERSGIARGRILQRQADGSYREVC